MTENNLHSGRERCLEDNGQVSRVSTDVVTGLESSSRPGFSTQVFPNGFYLRTLS